jgi:hypothetical protein
MNREWHQDCFWCLCPPSWNDTEPKSQGAENMTRGTRRIIMLLTIITSVLGAGGSMTEAGVLKKLMPSSTPKASTSGRCQKSGGLFQSRPVSPKSTWSHQHPKWSAGRKATGAAYLP